LVVWREGRFHRDELRLRGGRKIVRQLFGAGGDDSDALWSCDIHLDDFQMCGGSITWRLNGYEVFIFYFSVVGLLYVMCIY
jgi:hypothetical protein